MPKTLLYLEANFIQMIKYVMILWMMVTETVEMCGEGCLQCDKKNKCTLCDVTNRYYLSDHSCKYSELRQCKTLALDGECAQCQEDYYFDRSTKRCVAVQASKLISNCLYYGGDQNCVQCSAKYFFNGTLCEKVSKLVDNCENYSSDGVCSECEKGFIFNFRRNACNKSPKTAGCLAYTYLQCMRCAPGYVPNPNLYLFNYLSNSSLILSDIRAFENGGYRDWISFQYCHKIQVKNCLVASMYNTCTKCEDRYFLTQDNNCRSYPEPGPIESCYSYSSNTTCSECYEDYYLETESKCTIIDKHNAIPDCVAYNRTAHIVQCVKCVDLKYLDNGNCLLPKADLLNNTNCEISLIDSDSCAVCKENYLLTSDRKRCLVVIPHCIEYESSTIETTQLVCDKYSVGYNLNMVGQLTEYFGGEMGGCLKYSSNNTCIQCDSRAYYMSDGQCMKNVLVANCLQYSQTTINECKSCDTGYFPFRFHKTCSPIPVIDYCIDYLDENTCKKCIDGFDLIQNKCVCTNERFKTCKVTTDDTSILKICDYGYIWINLPFHKGCYPNHQYILMYCNQTKTELVLNENGKTNVDSCRVCKENSYPVTLRNMFVCIDDRMLITKGVDDAKRVEGCLKYDIKEAIPVCVQCLHYLNVSSDDKYTCVETCDEMTHTVIADNLNGFYNTCAPQNHTSFGLLNCAEAIRVFKGDTIALECVKAKPEFVFAVPMDISTNNPSCYKDIEGSTVPKPEGALFYHGFYTTIYEKNSTSIKHDNQRDEKQNCELYYNNSGSLNCMRCKWGYSVLFNADTSTSNCVLVSECDTSISYTGFSMVLNRLLSCHSCFNSKVLTVTIEIIDDSFDYVQKSFIDRVPALQCATPTNNNPSINSPLLVSNCLIYGWFTVSSANSTVVKGCLACMPGFRLAQNFGHCSEIDNCAKIKNNVANGCSACTQTNSTNEHEYKAFKDHYADRCYLVSTDNCLFVNYEASSKTKMDCRVCRPGFWLNYDKQCELISLPKCSSTVNFQNFYTSTAFNSADSLAEYYTIKHLSQAVSLNGCDVCETGYTGFKLQTDEKQCVFSPYVQKNKFEQADEASYITDCATYQIVHPGETKPNSLCEKCKNDKIPNYLRDKCVTSLVNGCRIAFADNGSSCFECLDTHILSSGICLLKNITNCFAYDPIGNGLDLVCNRCNDEYVLAANQKSCYKGNVFGCKSYNLGLPWVCKTCLETFALINTAASKTYCINIREGPNCLSVDNTDNFNLTSGYINCNKCIANNVMAFIPKLYETQNTTREQSICLKLNEIPGCITYGTNETSVSANSFLCKRCSNGYYLNETDYTCISRNNKPSGCEEFYSNMDKCKKCGFKYIKSLDETDCILFANYIPRCKIYLNEIECSMCEPPFYLKDNWCFLSTVINNCTHYTQNYTCDACDAGYFLQNSTTCVKAIAQNCHTYDSINACKTCDPLNKSMGLKNDSNGIVNCVKKDVLFCDISTDKFPFKCEQCQRGYYPSDEGVCNIATNIDNCLIYETSVTCRQCDPGAVLSIDKQNCDKTILGPFNDPNCIESRERATPVCSKCYGILSIGDYSCPFYGSPPSKNCFIYNSDQNQKCSVCEPGGFQLPEGRCINPEKELSVLIIRSQNNTVASSNPNGTNNTNVTSDIPLNEWYRVSLIIVLLLELINSN